MTKLSDLNFVDTTPKVAVNAAKKWLKNKRKMFTSNTNFTSFSREGGVGYENFGKVCHAGIDGVDKSFRACVATEISITRRLTVNPKYVVEDFEPFLKWFLYDSHCSQFIINRDDYEFCRDYGIIVSGKTPYQLMQTCMIMSRNIKEVPIEAFRRFNELTTRDENPVDPFFAFLALFCTGYRGREDDQVVTKNGHRVSHFFSPEAFKNYYAGDAVQDLTTPFYDRATIYGSSCLFVPENQLEDAIVGSGKTLNYSFVMPDLWKKDKVFNNLLKTSRGEKPDDTAYRPPNPFAKKENLYAPVQTFTYKELFEVLFPYLQETGVIPKHG